MWRGKISSGSSRSQALNMDPIMLMSYSSGSSKRLMSCSAIMLVTTIQTYSHRTSITFVEAHLPVPDIAPAPGHAIEPFSLATFHVQITSDEYISIGTMKSRRKARLTLCISTAAQASKTPSYPSSLPDASISSFVEPAQPTEG